MEKKLRGMRLETKLRIFIGITLICLMALSYIWIAKMIDDVAHDLSREKVKTTYQYLLSSLKAMSGGVSLEEVPLEKLQNNLKALSSQISYEVKLVAESEPVETRLDLAENENGAFLTYRAPLYEGGKNPGIGLSITLPVDDIFNRLKTLRRILLAVIAPAILVALAMTYYIIRSAVIEPVNHLKDIAQRIVSGDYSARSHITTGDELEEFSKSFNKMIEHLENLNNNLDSKLNDLGMANLQLYEMNRLQREFMAVMSHELRTPLNSIIGFSEILSQQWKGKIDEKQQKFLQNIYTSGKHLLRLINEILDVAKIESGRLELHIDTVSIAGVIESALSMIDAAEKERVPVRLEIQESLPAISSDEGRLIQIVYNLLSNAFKVSPDGAPITIAARRTDNMVRLQITDSGPGIPADQIPLVFEKFRQLDSSRTRNLGGTGLGLSIVKELTSLLGGKVSVDSEVGKGSTFTIEIPLSRHGPNS